MASQLPGGRWYVCIDGKDSRGPLSVLEISADLKTGRLPPSVWVQPVGEGAEPNEESWDYAFSYIEFREMIPKPVVGRKTPTSKAPTVSATANESWDGQMLDLRAVLHNRIRLFEGDVKRAQDQSFFVSNLGRHSLKKGENVFLHLYDPKTRKSVNVWTGISDSSPDALCLEYTELPAMTRKRLSEILDGATRSSRSAKKAA